MNQEIVLTRDGFIKVIVQEEKQENSYILPESRALRVLKSNQLSLERGFSLRSYFKIFKNYPILQTLEDWIGEYLEEMEKCPPIGCISKEMPSAYIQLKKVVEIDRVKSRKKYIDENGEFNFNTKEIELVDEKLYSMRFDVSMVDPDSEDETRYAIEFTPLNEILDVPIKINNKASILKKATSSIGKMRFKSDEYEDQVGITLYEFMTEIIYEVSFLGAPETRDEEKEEIKKRIQEVEKGEVELIPFEDVKEKMSEKLNEIRKNQEDKED